MTTLSIFKDTTFVMICKCFIFKEKNSQLNPIVYLSSMATKTNYFLRNDQSHEKIMMQGIFRTQYLIEIYNQYFIKEATK